MIPGIIESQSVAATSWQALSSTPSTYNGIVDVGISSGACLSQSGVQSRLNSAAPPRNFSVGYIMRVTHKYNSPSGTYDCPVYYFIAV